MNRDAVRAALQTGGLSRIMPHLETLISNSIRMISKSIAESEVAVGASKIGGAPDLPDDVIWPLMGDVPLSFLAQINLSDVQPFDTDKLLPSSGMLYFFYDANQQTYGSDPADRAGRNVIYSVVDTASVKRHPFPDALPVEARFASCAVTFSSEMTLPQRPNLLDSTLDWNDKERQAYSDLMADFPSVEDRKMIHHRLLGHSDDLQDDMHLQAQMLSHGFTDDQSPEAKVLVDGATDWILLFQLDSDSDAHMQWASTGLLYFWIMRQDLQALKFDNVWVVLQSE